MNRALSTALAVVTVLAGITAPASARGSALVSESPAPVRLQGTFAMAGTVTIAHHVYGEHRGERVRRTWAFLPQCAIGTCRRVLLARRRSNRRLLDLVMLVRQPSGTYRGRGRFWVALRCAGRVIALGGVATETITARVTRTRLIGATRFATALSATYTNPRRANLTRCPGGIGHDAASYRGHLTSPLPAPPTAGFAAAPDPATGSVTFTQQASPGEGAPQIVAWSWNFGDPSSPANTSTLPDPTHQFSAPGTYTVTLTVTDGYGQTATYATAVTI